MTDKTYTIAEFKKNTRKILNEALASPVTIKRYDDQFILSNAAATEKQVVQMVKDKITDVKQNIVNSIVGEPEKDVEVPINSEIPVVVPKKVLEDRKLERIGKPCEHGQLKGNCLFKGCPFNARF